MNDTLIESAAELQRRANEIITDLDLTARLGALGTPVRVGSSRFGLMVNPNIDFEVYTAKPRIRDGFDLLRAVAEHPGVRQIVYRNFLGTDDPGLYWRIDYEDTGAVLWDIDVWLVPDDHPHAWLADRFARAMERVLTGEARRAILAIKRSIPRASGVRGIDIYKAVLEGNVKTAEEFRAWLASHPVTEGIDPWMP